MHRLVPCLDLIRILLPVSLKRMPHEMHLTRFSAKVFIGKIMTDFVFIDSGVGGIPYMTTLLQRAPDSSCVYVADTENFPYGEKTHDEVVSCVISLVEKICKRFEPSVIVVACNTISVNALAVLRQKFPSVKFVGTVPAIKLAASVSEKKAIGLLATQATCDNDYNIELKNRFAADCKLVCRGDGNLVSFIEHNAFTASRQSCLDAVKPAVDFFRDNGCDVIILGCTHFLNITDVFEEASAPDIKIVDSVDGVVRHALEVLKECRTCEPAGDFRGACSLRRGGSGRPLAGCNEGETSPALYVTGISDLDEKKQYEEICKRYGIKLIDF